MKSFMKIERRKTKLNNEELKDLLLKYKFGILDLDSTVSHLESLDIKELGYASVDNMREARVGYAEVIYCEGKTPKQVAGIADYMNSNGDNILGTRASKEVFLEVKNIIEKAEYNEEARLITIKNKNVPLSKTKIAVVTAGTSDINVAEEAAITAEFYGNVVDRFYDVGVAGIHRLFDKIDEIRKAKVIVVAAGMEGALASVVGGLVDKPVIAVPTSVGYGANFNGLAALLSMLNSCASGVSVVNIDNGFGAGYLAGMINRL